MKILKAILLALAVTISMPTFGNEVDINTMDAETIAEALQGIGLKKAQAIVTYRETHGPFERVEDLTQVRGIGPKTLARIRGNITLNAAPQ